MAVLLVAGCTGLTGPGVLSSSSVQDDNSGHLRIEYDRQIHLLSPTTFRVQTVPSDGAIRIELEGEVARSLTSSKPAPASQETAEDKILLTYAAQGTQPAVVELTYRPERWGLRRSVISTAASQVHVAQIVFP